MTLEKKLHLAGNGLRTAVGLGCAYEAFALATRRVPTFSQMCGHSKQFEAIFLGALIAHIHLERRLVEVLKTKLIQETELCGTEVRL